MGDSVEDFLEVDSTVPGQAYGVFSFLSPENVLKKKEVYMMSEFLKYISDNSEFLKNNLTGNDKLKLNYNTTKELYDDFIFKREEDLENKFHEMEDFRTTVRGFKARGNYATQREAEVRAKVLQRLYKNDNIFVGPIGYWCPWDPNPERIENQEYLEPELNTLMQKYKDNSTKRDMFYQQQKDDQIRAKSEERINREKELKEIKELKQTDNSQNIVNTMNTLEDKDPWMKQKESDNK
jgi:hypothetical protein